MWAADPADAHVVQAALRSSESSLHTKPDRTDTHDAWVLFCRLQPSTLLSYAQSRHELGLAQLVSGLRLSGWYESIFWPHPADAHEGVGRRRMQLRRMQG